MRNLLKLPKTIKYLSHIEKPYFNYYGVLEIIGEQGGRQNYYIG